MSRGNGLRWAYRARIGRRGLARRLFWPRLERLEHREMLDAAASSIVVGRTLSSYTVGGIQNSQETITYTVYNNQADPETGVVVATTLQPGVSYVSATAEPDRNGQSLSWNLGTIGGYGRASVSLTVALSSAVPLQLDGGAQAFAMLDGAAVTNSTPAATLRAGTVDASLLASTPDANTTDPYVQDTAATLGYDPQRIFDFLHGQIGYNSYAGSVRGARGTLWSGSGNALDVASLGVALMRASGIPAQYAQGTLSAGDAQGLILSMFPAGYQTVGKIDPGATTSNPANDYSLLTETENHYWFQFDPGSGFQDADPLMSGATVGKTFTTSTGTFAEVADSLREKTEIKLNAEFYSQGLFGLGGGLSTQTVLDQTFNDVDLVGHPLTVGNLVTQNSTGFIITATTNTYSPYIEVGDVAYPGSSGDELIRGTEYQEVLTSFPFGSSVLTGVFLDVTLSGPQGAPQTSERALVDRIGPAIRQNGGTPNISVSPSDPPPLTSQDAFTLMVTPGQQSLEVAQPVLDNLQNEVNQLQALANSSSADSSPFADSLLHEILRDSNIAAGLSLLASSDVQSARAADSALVREYADRPRLTLLTNRISPSADGKSTIISSSIDLRRDTVRVIAYPGQATDATIAYNVLRGYSESQLEDAILASSLPNPSPQSGVYTQASAYSIYQAAVAQGIPIVAVTAQNLSILDTLAISADAKARISTSVQSGLTVFVPSQSVVVNGSATTAWYEVNPSTGETVGVTEDGGHQTFGEYAAATVFAIFLIKIASVGFAYFYPELAAHITSSFLRIRYESWDLHAQRFSGSFPYIINNPDQSIINAAKAALRKEKQAAIRDFYSWAATIHNISGVSTYSITKAFSDTLRNDLWDLIPNDPPLGSMLVDPTGASYDANGVEGGANTSTITAAANLAPGAAAANVTAASASVSGSLTASWTGLGTSSFSVTSLSAQSAVVKDANGNVVGTGIVSLSAAAPVSSAVTGKVAFGITGDGLLAFFALSASGLTASGNWTDYTATATGQMSVSLTSDGLSLNGQALPSGTYTIVTSSATLVGSGASTSPSFSSSAFINATSAAVNLGSGSGTLSVGGKPLDPSSGAALTGYTGEVSISPSGTDISAVLMGNAGAVLLVPAGPASLTANQNAPATFPLNLLTSLDDTYQVTIVPPPGDWTTSISNGQVTVTPAPGLAAGNYTLRIIARSTTNPDLVIQGTVSIQVTAVTPGITLSADPNPQFLIPYNGAEVPTAFRVSIQNLGPAADTFQISAANIPSGFSLVQSATTDLIPAGKTGIVDLYLVPNGTLPAPGTAETFNVTATSKTNAMITKTQTVSFAMPTVDAVTVSSSLGVSTTPGTAVTQTITLTNVGNVAENNVTLSSTTSAGLTLTGLPSGPITLAVGQSVTETVTLTPDAATPFNSTLNATVSASLGNADALSPSLQAVTIPVQVVAPGVGPVNAAAVAAAQAGNAGLSGRLNDLTTALTTLFVNPADPVAKGAALANLQSLISQVTNDPFLSGFTSALTTAQTALGAATTASQVNDAETALGQALGSLANVIADEAKHQFTLALSPAVAIVQPNAPETFDLVLINNGSVATTYDLSVSGLPAGVTASFNQTSVTVQPGQQINGGNNAVTLTLTESGAALFATGFTVSAVAEGATEIALSTPGSLTLRPESILAANVTTTPPYTSAGGSVDVKALVADSVNEPTTILASYKVTDSNGTVLFTSTPVTVNIAVSDTTSTVDLGSVDTTGFVNGTDTVTAILTKPDGTAIPGASALTTLLIGQPVSGSLTTTPANVPTGTATVTSTVQVNTFAGYPSPLSLLGSAATPASGTSVAVLSSGGKTYAYESGTGGVNIIDVTDPANPSLLATFGQSDIVNGQFGFNVVRIVQGQLIVGTSNGNNGSVFNLLDYSLANPTAPTLTSNTTINYRFLSDLLVNSTGTAAFVPTGGVYYSGSTIFSRFGDLVALDLSNPANPTVAGALYTNRGQPDGGDNPQSGGVLVNDQIAYTATTTAGGNNVSTGVGQIFIVNIADPTNMSLIKALQIPGTQSIVNIAVQGNRALVVGNAAPLGSTIDFNTKTPGGQLTLTVLDISDPSNPLILGSTLVTNEQFPSNEAGAKTDVVSLGNGDFAVSDNDANGKPDLMIVDPSNPSNIIVATAEVPSGVHGITVLGNTLYATTSSGLSIYDIGSLVSDPVTVTVNLPAGASKNIVSGSYNIAPDQVTTGPNGDTLVWNRHFASGNTSYAFSWQSTLSNVTAGAVIAVTTGASLTFEVLGTPGTATLPGTSVTGVSIINVTPATNTAPAGGSATYDVRLFNPTTASITYYLGTSGLTNATATFDAYSVTIPAGGTVDDLMHVKPYAFAPLGSEPFTVTATDQAGSGVAGTASATLIVSGTPVIQADTEAHGIVAAITPAKAFAGPGTPASYSVELTNVGSQTETFLLAANLPAGFQAEFSRNYVTLQPGAVNSISIPLSVTPDFGTAPGVVPFTVTATSSASPDVNGSAGASIDVTQFGVSVYLSPSSQAPGSTFQMQVTNQGTVADTFDLSLGGPGALTATLGKTSVTLAPGATETVPITTTSADFAVQGTLNLLAIATSRGNPKVSASATASMTVSPTIGLASNFVNPTQIIPIPGTTSFLLLVKNTGNTEDTYSVSITGTTGPLTASLLDGATGLPTQSIGVARLSGLTQGVFLVNTDLKTAGKGTVTLTVKSLSHATESSVSTAEVSSSAAAQPTQIALSSSASTVEAGQSVTIRAVVQYSATAKPNGNVLFKVNGISEPPVKVTTANGVTYADLTLSGLPAGTLSIAASYSGDSIYSASPAANLAVAVVTGTVTVTPGAVIAPVITSVVRNGYHNEPTSLVLTFSEPLDSTSAENVANYQISGPAGTALPIASATYDPAAHTVTVIPRVRLNLHDVYTLTVIGSGPTGIKSAAGVLMGSNSTTALTASNLVLGVPAPGGPRRLARLEREVGRIAHRQRTAAIHHLPRAMHHATAPHATASKTAARHISGTAHWPVPVTSRKMIPKGVFGLRRAGHS